MSFSAFDVYNAILAIFLFQITRGHGQLKRHLVHMHSGQYHQQGP